MVYFQTSDILIVSVQLLRATNLISFANSNYTLSANLLVCLPYFFHTKKVAYLVCCALCSLGKPCRVKTGS